MGGALSCGSAPLSVDCRAPVSFVITEFFQEYSLKILRDPSGAGAGTISMLSWSLACGACRGHVISPPVSASDVTCGKLCVSGAGLERRLRRTRSNRILGTPILSAVPI